MPTGPVFSAFCPDCEKVDIDPRELTLFIEPKAKNGREARATVPCSSCGVPFLINPVRESALRHLLQFCTVVQLPGPAELDDPRREDDQVILTDDYLDFILDLRHRRNLAVYAEQDYQSPVESPLAGA